MTKNSVENNFYESLWKQKKKHIEAIPVPVRVIAAADLAQGGQRLLDVGCGQGILADLIKNKYKEIYGIEISNEIAGIAVSKGINISNININSEPFPYEDNFFDTVVCLDIIEHVFEPIRLLKESIRVLKKDGCLILSTPNIRYIYHLNRLIFKGRFPKTSADNCGYDGGHIHYFTFTDIEQLLQQAGFVSIEKCTFYKWGKFTHFGKLKDTIKGCLGERFKREFFSAGIIIKAIKDK